MFAKWQRKTNPQYPPKSRATNRGFGHYNNSWPWFFSAATSSCNSIVSPRSVSVIIRILALKCSYIIMETQFLWFLINVIILNIFHMLGIICQTMYLHNSYHLDGRKNILLWHDFSDVPLNFYPIRLRENGIKAPKLLVCHFLTAFSFQQIYHISYL